MLIVALLITPLAVIQARPAAAVSVPTGFVDGLVTDAVPQPTGLAFTPDGRMLIAGKAGSLYVFKNEVLVGKLNFEYKVCSNWERGLVGVAVDPDFGQGTNRTIYVYYTFNKNGTCPLFNDPDRPPASQFPVNRVSKFTLADDNTMDPDTEVVILDHIPSYGIHNSGHLEFGPVDRLLYVSVGDGGCRLTDLNQCGMFNDNARRRDILLGKIVRLNRDGTVPSTNPYAQDSGVRRCGNPAGVPAGTGRCGEIYAYGLRNPFRFTFKPGTGTFHINDVGDNIWEEIDLGAKGADYGWNAREGRCKANSQTDCGTPPSGMTNPVHVYNHDTGCTSVTGAAFVPEGLWPAPYSGSYLFGDFVCGRIFRLAPQPGGGYAQVPFVDNAGDVVHMTFGPFGTTQALYYLNFSDQVRRISFGLPSEMPPSASFTASTLSAPAAPLVVNLDSSASTDPDRDPLTYHWNFGDGATLATADPTISHTFTQEGAFKVTLRVEDDARLSAPVTKLVEVGDPPAASILSPSASARFAVGDRVTLTGQGTDPDETLDGSDLSWRVIRHHNNSHTHPFLGPIKGTSLSFIYPSPEDLQAADSSHLEAILTVTDSTGLSRTVSRHLLPKKVSITVKDNRSTALELHASDLTISDQRTFTSWAGYVVRLYAPSPQQFPGRYYQFESWSDGKAQTHDIVTPASATTYTANFKRVDGTSPAPPPPPPPPPPPADPSVQGIARTPSGFGYWLASDNGRVQAFGNAPLHGDASSLPLNKPIAGMAPTPSGQGYWLVATDGGVFSYGDAQFWGSTGGIRLNQPIVGMAATPSGKGYWLVAADGGIFTFGDAPFKGSTGDIILNRPIVAMDTTPSGAGYWLVAADGGIFTFGDAPFMGSTGDLNLNKPVVAMDATPAGDGYWLMGSDGGVFAFHAPFLGSAGSLASPGVGIASTPAGAGYWLAGTDSSVLNYGDAPAL